MGPVGTEERDAGSATYTRRQERHSPTVAPDELVGYTFRCALSIAIEVIIKGPTFTVMHGGQGTCLLGGAYVKGHF